MRVSIEKLQKIDRRIIFILIAVAVVILLLHPLFIEVKPTPEVKAVYETIEGMKPGEVFFLVLDFDPASKPELYPMSEALLRHSFRKNLRVIGTTLWPTGAGMGEKVFSDIAKEFGKESGKDYLYLGWQPGGSSVVIGLGESITETFPRDHYGKPTEGMPVLANISSLKDITYLLDLAAGATVGVWYYYGRLLHKFKMGGGCTGVSAAEWHNLVKIGWINGFLGGLRGAAEYETLINKKAFAVAGMDAQSITHVLIIALIIFSNILLFIAKGTSK